VQIHHHDHPSTPPLRRERRGDRLIVPPCERCGSRDTAAACRTDYVVYVRCSDCGEVWSLPKPEHE
jgi:hypothetical protein